MAAHLHRLSGLLEIGAHPSAESIQAGALALREAGMVDAYLGDLFLEISDTPDPGRLVFHEGSAVLQFRPDWVYDLVGTVLASAGLTAESAHYNQILPPPGVPPADWLFAYHKKMMAVARRMGLKRVTTHPGWMFGSAMPEHLGETAMRYRTGACSQTELNRAAFERYGGDERVWKDSVHIYRYMCASAAEAGAEVTIETAISEWYDLTLYPERMRAFCEAVGAPNIGICVDAGHCHLNGLNVADVIRACGPMMRETHFHDNYGQRDEHNPIGDGTIAWPEVLHALRDIGYSGLITFEQKKHGLNAARWNALIRESNSG